MGVLIRQSTLACEQCQDLFQVQNKRNPKKALRRSQTHGVILGKLTGALLLSHNCYSNHAWLLLIISNNDFPTRSSFNVEPLNKRGPRYLREANSPRSDLQDFGSNFLHVLGDESLDLEPLSDQQEVVQVVQADRDVAVVDELQDVRLQR